MAGSPHRFEIWLVDLSPVRGFEIAKTRPCVVVSPDELNTNLKTLLTVPLTSTSRGWPHRVPVDFAGVAGELATEQMRNLDRSRFIRRLGYLDDETARRLSTQFVDMFRW